MAYRAITSFRVGNKKGVGGPRRGFVPGDVVSDDDPVLRKHKHLFEPMEDYLRAVEEASASPGVKRDVGVKVPTVKGGKK